MANGIPDYIFLENHHRLYNYTNRIDFLMGGNKIRARLDKEQYFTHANDKHLLFDTFYKYLEGKTAGMADQKILLDNYIKLTIWSLLARNHRTNSFKLDKNRLVIDATKLGIDNIYRHILLENKNDIEKIYDDLKTEYATELFKTPPKNLIHYLDMMTQQPPPGQQPPAGQQPQPGQQPGQQPQPEGQPPEEEQPPEGQPPEEEQPPEGQPPEEEQPPA